MHLLPFQDDLRVGGVPHYFVRGLTRCCSRRRGEEGEGVREGGRNTTSNPGSIKRKVQEQGSMKEISYIPLLGGGGGGVSECESVCVGVRAVCVDDGEGIG